MPRIREGIRDLISNGDKVVQESTGRKGIVIEHNDYHGFYRVEEEWNENNMFQEEMIVGEADICPEQYWKG